MNSLPLLLAHVVLCLTRAKPVQFFACGAGLSINCSVVMHYNDMRRSFQPVLSSVSPAELQYGMSGVFVRCVWVEGCHFQKFI